jgi:hypothetical protein
MLKRITVRLAEPPMSDEMPPPPFVYEGLDPVPEPKSAIAEVSEAVKGTAHRVGDAIMLVENPACH